MGSYGALHSANRRCATVPECDLRHLSAVDSRKSGKEFDQWLVVSGQYYPAWAGGLLPFFSGNSVQSGDIAGRDLGGPSW
jgi:hypothetical protein